jgi:hypothetical protein
MDLISTQQRSQLQASPAAQPTAAAGNYAAAEVETQADKQRIMDSIRQQVGHVIDCLDRCAWQRWPVQVAQLTSCGPGAMPGAKRASSTTLGSCDLTAPPTPF